jgi:hypothetical protein
MKTLHFLFLPLLFSLTYFSATGQADTSGIQHGKIYELKLKAPVKCIQRIEYDKTSEEPKWKLSDDNKVIYIEDYVINSKVKLKVVYETGREEEYTQSPCSIRLSEKQPAL